MSRNEELIQAIDEIFDINFTIDSGTVVPTVDDLTFDNVARDILATILFIDIKGSTHIVEAIQRETAAKMYKAFLKGVTSIARTNDGDIRSFNGDGILVVFVGLDKANNAVRAAMEMKYFFQEILTRKINSYRPQNTQLRNIQFDFGIGIDQGNILVIKAGARGENNRDLVWVGKVTNRAAKLSERSNQQNHIYITQAVYGNITDNNLLYTTNITGPLEQLFRTDIWTSTLPLHITSLPELEYTTIYRMPIS